MHAEVKNVIFRKTQTVKQAAENLRKRLVAGMLHGSKSVIDLDTTVPPLKTQYDIPSVLPLKDLIFDREKLFKDYMSIVRDSENFSIHKEYGGYLVNPKFQLIVLYNMKDTDCDDEIIQMVLDELPNEEKFTKIYINPEK